MKPIDALLRDLRLHRLPTLGPLVSSKIDFNAMRHLTLAESSAEPVGDESALTMVLYGAKEQLPSMKNLTMGKLTDLFDKFIRNKKRT